MIHARQLQIDALKFYHVRKLLSEGVAERLPHFVLQVVGVELKKGLFALILLKVKTW